MPWHPLATHGCIVAFKEAAVRPGGNRLREAQAAHHRFDEGEGVGRVPREGAMARLGRRWHFFS